MLPPTVKCCGIITKAQTRAPKYLSWRMTARSQWTYFLEALGRVVWFMTWRNHEGLVEMSPPLGSIYTVSTAGIHHLHITTPPRLVGDRTSGFVQSLTDSSSQDNKAYLRFREGRCWKCLHCFYRAEQQTTQSLLSSGVFLLFPFFMLQISVQNDLPLICPTHILDFFLHSSDF